MAVAEPPGIAKVDGGSCQHVDPFCLTAAEPVLSRQLAAAAGGAGYAVDCAGDGEAADLLVHDEQCDAVILDLGLPKVDGVTRVGPHGARKLAREGARGRWRRGPARVSIGGVPVRLTSHELPDVPRRPRCDADRAYRTHLCAGL